MNGISLIAVVKNEEKIISKMLESVNYLAHEKIIVDTGSTDRTVEVCQDYGAKIINNPQEWHINIFEENKNLALKHASRKWILNLDADEELSSDLVSEMGEFVQSNKYDALKMKRLHFHRNDPTTQDQVIRLFKSSQYFFKNNPNSCHTRAVIDEAMHSGNYKNSVHPIYHWKWMYITKEQFLVDLERYKEYKPHFSMLAKQFDVEFNQHH